MGFKDTLSTLRTVGTVGVHIGRERFGPKVRPITSDVVPPSAEAITPEWATDALCKKTPGAIVTDVTVLGGDDGTSSRRRLQITYNQAGVDAGLPDRVFTKSATSFFSRMLLGVTGIAQGESVFYTDLRDEMELRSPHAYYARFDPRTHRSMVLLEDLAEQGWDFPDPVGRVITRGDAQDMIDQMAIYHAAYWKSPRLSALGEAHAWQVDLNRKVGFEGRTMRGFDRAAQVIPAGLLARRAELYPAFMASLERHAREPQTLLHQDVHPGNWLRDADGKMGLYDWQCVAAGHWALDVSYALGAVLATDDRRNWQEDLIRRYTEQLADRGVPDAPGFDEAWEAYRLHPLHGLAFGLFTLGGTRLEPELQPRDYTLSAIELLAAHVDDLGTLDLFA